MLGENEEDLNESVGGLMTIQSVDNQTQRAYLGVESVRYYMGSKFFWWYFTPVLIQLIMAILNVYFAKNVHHQTEEFLTSIGSYSKEIKLCGDTNTKNENYIPTLYTFPILEGYFKDLMVCIISHIVSVLFQLLPMMILYFC